MADSVVEQALRLLHISIADIAGNERQVARALAVALRSEQASGKRLTYAQDTLHPETAAAIRAPGSSLLH